MFVWNSNREGKKRGRGDKGRGSKEGRKEEEREEEREGIEGRGWWGVGVRRKGEGSGWGERRVFSNIRQLIKTLSYQNISCFSLSVFFLVFFLFFLFIFWRIPKGQQIKTLSPKHVTVACIESIPPTCTHLTIHGSNRSFEDSVNKFYLTLPPTVTTLAINDFCCEIQG